MRCTSKLKVKDIIIVIIYKNDKDLLIWSKDQCFEKKQHKNKVKNHLFCSIKI